MNLRTSALLRALFVTFLWSTSWLFIRAGLQDIPPVTFAALRYSLAALLLWGVHFSRRDRKRFTGSSRDLLPRLILLGIIFYSITQASQFVALDHLPATTLSLLLTSTTVITALIARVAIGERTRPGQWIGIAAYVTAAAVFLTADLNGRGDWIGYTAAIAGIVSNAAAGVLGRSVNGSGRVSGLQVTLISMTAGSLVLLGTALAIDGVPALGLRQWGILAWLAVVNTALAFVLWNTAQRELKAVETSVINSTMLFQISLLAVLFLGERLSLLQWSMIGVGGLGALAVQLSDLQKPQFPRRRGRFAPATDVQLGEKLPGVPADGVD